MKSTFIKSATSVLALSPAMAMAHPGHGSMAFTNGLTHPVTGIDHLIMLVAFGLLVGCLKATSKQKLGLVAGAFATLMVGLFIGHSLGVASGVEAAIVASLFVVSAAIWQVFSASQRMIKLAVGVCMSMMFFHGYAHGVEAHGTIGQFAMGMGISAVALMGLGVQGGRLLASPWLSIAVATASSLFLVAS
ncbi:HupE/UreJ family protein [uncultured Vibrio sp.]|uniref:HupE/UreJ family protein n=1 Tax=uncultured Vibrio sp. TaxID=114054 RepID=UPI0025CE73F2|nr:HupE/UreJ family protein [uncultured Vibrio sp.]